MKYIFNKTLSLLLAAATLLSVNAFAVNSFAADVIPESYSSRDLGYVTPVKSQGATSACWAFATIAALETDAVKKGWETADSADFSEAHLVWSVNSHPSDVGDYFINDDSLAYKTGGGTEKAVYPAISGYGLADESEYPFGSYFNSEGDFVYIDSDTGNEMLVGYYTDNQLKSNNGYTVGGYKKLNTSDDVKQWVMEHGSACVSVYYNRIGSLKSKDYSSVPVAQMNDGTMFNSSASTTNHAMTVVGWCDSFPKDFFKTALTDAPLHDGAWLCKNSMGENSINSGYVWVSYDDTSPSNFIGLSLDKATDNTYTYNYSKYSSDLTITTTKPLSIANVYNVGSKQILKAVALPNNVPNTSATIKVYKLKSGYTSPTDGVCIYSVDQVLDEGYYRFYTDSEALEPGTYSVVATVSQSGSKVIVPVENPNNGIYNYSASGGQSFLSVGKWNDVTTISADYGNFYLNMYTDDYIDESLCENGHTEVTDEGVAPSCAKNGLTEGRHCSVCKKVIVPQEAIAATGHTPTEPLMENYTDSTCTVAGHYDAVTFCAVCNREIKRERVAVPVKGHGYDKTTYSGSGKRQGECIVCGRTQTITDISSFAADNYKVVKGGYIKWTVKTNTDVTSLRLITTYTTTDGIQKSGTKIYTLATDNGNVTVADSGSSRVWTITQRMTYVGLDKFMKESVTLSYTTEDADDWYVYSNTPKAVTVGSTENFESSKNTRYEPYHLISVKCTKSAEKGQRATLTIKTTDDCSKVRIGYMADDGTMKYTTYQTTSTNVTYTDSSGVRTWVINYKVPGDAEIYHVSTRGPSWGAEKTIAI